MSRTGPQMQKLCAFCGGDAAAFGGRLGRLEGPYNASRSCYEAVYVHHECAVWSPKTSQDEQLRLRSVGNEVRRARKLRCSSCGLTGAASGCRVSSCSRCYHLPCAIQAGCRFNHELYLMACPDHAPLFKKEPTDQAADRIGGPLAHLKLAGKRHMHSTYPDSASSKACSKDRKHNTMTAAQLGDHIDAAKAAYQTLAAELAAHAEDSEPDEAVIMRKDAKRLKKAQRLLAPKLLQPAADAQVQQHQADLRQQQQHMQQWQPSSGGFAAIGGLADVKRQLREMVLLPLAHPQLLQQLGIMPPRGILLHGPPGTGKTAIVRALAAECATVLGQGSGGSSRAKPVALFARKGTDCLGSYAGDAELHLRLLFEMAATSAPSIIFLDELDGLVPPRSIRSSSSDQIFASVVSVMLALMDGLHDRGQVLVIGATNRPDAIDPALRRPGRFDREVFFNLPSQQDRREILAVHTAKWSPPPPDMVLQQLAAATDGWAGADLQSLVAGALMAAVRRTSPQLLAAVEQQQQQQSHEHPEQQLLVQQQQPENGADQQQGGCVAALRPSRPGAVLQCAHPAGDSAPPPASLATTMDTSFAAEVYAPQCEQLPDNMLVDIAPASAAAATAAAAAGASSVASPVAHAGGFLAALSSYMVEQQQPHEPWLQPVAPVLSSPPMTVGQASPAGTEMAAVMHAAELHPTPAAAAVPVAPQRCDESIKPPRQPEVSEAAAAQARSNQQQQQQHQQQQRQAGQAGCGGVHGSAYPPVRQQGLPAVPLINIMTCDWAAALATAGPPASKREMSSLAGLNPAAPLPSPLVPLLLPAMAHVILHLHRWLLLGHLSEELASAATTEVTLTAGPASSDACCTSVSDLETTLARHGAVQHFSDVAPSAQANQTQHATQQAGSAAGPSSHAVVASSSSSSDRQSAPRSMLLHQPSGCHCLLLSGHGACGQSELAAAVLALLAAASSAAAVHTLTLPGMLLAGDGDVGKGLVTGMTEALSRVGRDQLLVVHMPRAELWALHAVKQAARKERPKASHGAWKHSNSEFGGGSAFDGILSSGSSSDVESDGMDGHSSATDSSDAEHDLEPQQQQLQQDQNNALSMAAAEQHAALPQRLRRQQQPHQPNSGAEKQHKHQSQQMSVAWSVFEQQLAMLSASQQGVLLLATMHLPSEHLPCEVQQLFGGDNLQQHQQWTGTFGLGRSNAVVQVCCCSSSSSRLAGLPETAINSARAVLANSLDRATAAALECYHHTQALAVPAAQTPAKHVRRAVEPMHAHVSSTGTSQQPQRQVTLAAAGSDAAARCTAVFEQQRPQPVAPLQRATEQHEGACTHQQLPQQQQTAHADVLKLQQLNVAQQEQANQLFDQVVQHVQLLGSLLLTDPRMPLAKAKQRQGERPLQASSAGAANQHQHQLAQVLPLAAVCTKAVRGWYWSLDEFQAEFSEAASRIRQQHASRRSHSRAVAAACALEDMLAMGCKEAAQQHKLYDPERIQWLHAVAEARKAARSRQQQNAHTQPPRVAPPPQQQQQRLPWQMPPVEQTLQQHEVQAPGDAGDIVVLPGGGSTRSSLVLDKEVQQQQRVQELTERLHVLAAAQLKQWDRANLQQQQQQEDGCSLSLFTVVQGFCRMVAKEMTSP